MSIKRGTSIIEIVIATALIAMSIIAALSLANHSQKQNTYAIDLAEATKFSSQAAEWIRSERNNLGWATLNTKNAATYCLNTFPADFTLLVEGSCGANVYIANTQFQRNVKIEKPSAAVLKFTIEVSWQQQVARQATIEMELAK